jgi:hypothetical protein
MIEFAKSMNALQSEMIVIGKNASGYNYNYADLPHVVESLYPVMTKHGFSVVQLPDSSDVDGSPVLTTTIFHVSGESMTGVFPIPDAGMSKQNAAQNVGSAITYIRRYAILAAFGVPVADDDAASLSAGSQGMDNQPFDMKGKNPRDDMGSGKSYKPGQKAERKPEQPDHEAKEVTAKKAFTCALCNSKGKAGDKMAFKRENGKPYWAHWDCYLDTELKKGE